MSKPQPPKPPLGRVMREGYTGANCPVCHSSMKRGLFTGRVDGCINPECPNYYLNIHLCK